MIADADGVIDPSSWEGLDEGVAEAAALGLARRNAEINGVSTASPLLKLQRAEDGSIIQLHRPPQRAPRQMTTPLRFGSEADRQRTSERQCSLPVSLQRAQSALARSTSSGSSVVG